jgi:hypothetical protein
LTLPAYYKLDRIVLGISKEPSNISSLVRESFILKRQN